MFSWLLLVMSMMMAHPAPHVVLITIDGTRYQEVFQGTDPKLYHNGAPIPPRDLVPNLYGYFVDQGVAIGKLTPMTASGPNFISLPGYLEITRGHPSTDCQRNDCDPVIDRSILQLYPQTAVIASWVGIHRTLPANYSGYADIGTPYYRWDVDTERAVWNYLSNHQPNFLWVSLGDTDKLAHANNYPGYIGALHQADAFIGELIRHSDPNTIFIVTCDHGRNKDFQNHGKTPAAQRVWLMLYGQGIPHRGFVRAEPVSLSNVYSTIYYFRFGVQSPDSILSRIQ
jgi:hypothetical protein